MSDPDHPSPPLDPLVLDALIRLGVAAGNRLPVDEPRLVLPRRTSTSRTSKEPKPSIARAGTAPGLEEDAP